jgi:hypothetical protein
MSIYTYCIDLRSTQKRVPAPSYTSIWWTTRRGSGIYTMGVVYITRRVLSQRRGHQAIMPTPKDMSNLLVTTSTSAGRGDHTSIKVGNVRLSAYLIDMLGFRQQALIMMHSDSKLKLRGQVNIIMPMHMLSMHEAALRAWLLVITLRDHHNGAFQRWRRSPSPSRLKHIAARPARHARNQR